MQSRIRWTRGDYISLGKAVSNFNKKINDLEKNTQKLYLPLTINYKDLKNDITTRKELKNKIKSLQRFLREAAEDLYITEGGEKISVWEYKELKILQRRAKNQLNYEILNIDRGKTPYETENERSLRGTLNSIKKLDTAEKEDFNRIKRRLNFVGSSDYEMKKAIIWRKNYLETLKKDYSNYQGYNEIIKLANRIKNPIQFYEYFKNHTRTFIDDYIRFLSRDKQGQLQFNDLLEELGIKTKDFQSDEIIEVT